MLVEEVRVLCRAGRRRPFLILLFAGFGALLVGKLVVGRSPRPTAIANLKLVQVISDEDTRALSRVELEAYLNKVVLSQSALAEMYRARLHEGPPDRLPTPRDIADMIREQSKVEVVNDRMFSLFSGNERRRSASIEIRVEDDSLAAASRVAQGLADLVTQNTTRSQSTALKVHALAARQAARRLSSQLASDRGSLSQVVGNAPAALGGKKARPQVTVTGRDGSWTVLPAVNQKRWQVAWARAARAEAAEHQAWMKWQSELHVPTVQAQMVSRRTLEPDSRARTLGIAVGLAFIFLLPLSTAAVGAFSGRIEAPLDLGRLGLVCLGEVKGEAQARPRFGV